MRTLARRDAAWRRAQAAVEKAVKRRSLAAAKALPIGREVSFWYGAHHRSGTVVDFDGSQRVKVESRRSGARYWVHVWNILALEAS